MPSSPASAWAMSPKLAAGRTVLKATIRPPQARRCAPAELNEYETRLFRGEASELPCFPVPAPPNQRPRRRDPPKNQQRRVFYAFQLSGRPISRCRLSAASIARTKARHRSSGSCSSIWLARNAGQCRLQRLAALGALTKGERQSLSSDLFRPEDVTDAYGKAALSRLYREIQTGRLKRRTRPQHAGTHGSAPTRKKTPSARTTRATWNTFSIGSWSCTSKPKIVSSKFFMSDMSLPWKRPKRQSAFDFGVEEIRAHNLRRIAEPETLFVDPAPGPNNAATNWKARSMSCGMVSDRSLWPPRWVSIGTSEPADLRRIRAPGRGRR